MKKLILVLTCLIWSVNSYCFSIEELLNLSSTNQLYSETKIDSSKKADILKIVEDIFNEASGLTNDGDDPDVSYSGFEPDDLYEDYFDIAQELYVGGYAKKAIFEQFVTEYNTLNNLKAGAPTEQTEKIEFWKQNYLNLWNSFLQQIQNNPQTCAGEGIPSTTRKCCQGLVELSLFKVTKKSCSNSASTCSDNTECCSGICNRDNGSVGTCAPLSCKSTGNSCNNNSDCCSSLCNKKNSNSPGVCATPKQCYKPVSLGQSCGDSLTPLCKQGECRQIDAGVFGGECSFQGKTCAVNNDCCSNKCSNNKCVSNKICKDCAYENNVPKSGQSCCEGLYLDTKSGKCKKDIRPMQFILPQANNSIFKILISNIFPIVYAQTRSEDNSEEEAIARAKSQCRDSHQVNTQEYNYCIEMAEKMVGSTKASEHIGLTPEQSKQLLEEKKQCNEQFPAGSVSRTDCLKDLDKKEQDLIKENKENGVDISGIKSGDLIKDYRAPVVTDKTYSDPMKCEFRSYNDNWKGASNLEKNAELFLRAFEVVYSGNGAQDYWQDGTKGNIFSRANNVAKKFRENRSKIIRQMNEIDVKMTCQCIGIWGPTNFPADKQSFFQSDACAEERSKVQTQLSVEVDENKSDDARKDNDGKSNVASLNSTNSADSIEKETARLEEIDKGAAAISHERLLIEWLGLRAEAQMDRFVDNSELEKELIELSTFIENKDFEEVWKGELKNEGKTLEKGNPEGDNVLLYRFGTKYYKGWVKIFLIVVGIALAVVAVYAMIASIGTITGGSILGVSVGASTATVVTYTSAGLVGGIAGGLIASVLGAYGSKGSPGVGDLQNFRKKSYSFFKNWDGYERFYIGPLYDNNSPVPATKCRIYAKASACLRSAYQIKLDGMEYLKEYEGRYHFVVDLNKPLYTSTDSSKYSMVAMPGLNKAWKDIMNDTRDEGVNFLMSTKPGGGSKSRGGKSYVVKKTKYLKEDVFQMAIDQKYFLPFRGNFNPVQWNLKSDLLKAIERYALCTEMKDSSNTDCFIADPEVKKDDIGFGYLFESETEAKEFAKYTYEMHYLYSQITKSSTMGYPLLGQDAYFRAVAYNMKLVGSLAAQRSDNYNETFNLYAKDWEKRISEYKSLGEVAAGLDSKNIKYGPAFYDTFGSLNFSGVTDIEAFTAIQKSSNLKARGGKGFNKAELSALEAGKSSAINTNNQIRKTAEYDKLRGSNLVSQKRNQRAGEFLNKLNNPLASFAMNKLGGGNGLENVNSALSDINQSLKEIEKNRGSRAGYKSGFNNSFSVPGVSIPSTSSSSSYSSDSFEEESNDAKAADTMSQKKARALIDNLNRSSDLSPNVDDSLWGILSKAYKRNYSRVLLKNERSSFDTVEEKTKAVPTTEEQKSLRELLESN